MTGAAGVVNAVGGMETSDGLVVHVVLEHNKLRGQLNLSDTFGLANFAQSRAHCFGLVQTRKNDRQLEIRNAQQNKCTSKQNMRHFIP